MVGGFGADAVMGTVGVEVGTGGDKGAIAPKVSLWGLKSKPYVGAIVRLQRTPLSQQVFIGDELSWRQIQGCKGLLKKLDPWGLGIGN